MGRGEEGGGCEDIRLEIHSDIHSTDVLLCLSGIIFLMLRSPTECRCCRCYSCAVG